MFKLKKFVNIFNLIVVCSLLVFSFSYFQFLDTKLNSYAFDYTYTDDTTATENYGTILKSIENIEQLTYEGTPIYHFSGSYQTRFKFSFLLPSSYSSDINVEKIAFTPSHTLSGVVSFGDDYASNSSLICKPTTTAVLHYRSRVTYNNVQYSVFTFEPDNLTDIYFASLYVYDLSYSDFGFNSASEFSFIPSIVFNDNLNGIIDLNSNTNYKIDFSNLYSNYSLNKLFFDILNGNGTYDYKVSTGNLPVYYEYYFLFHSFSSYPLIHNDAGRLRLYHANDVLPYESINCYGIYDFSVITTYDDSDSGNNFSDFISGYCNLAGIQSLHLYFIIHQPTYRTRNTLLIYNYGYDNFIGKSNKVTYCLRKSDDYYYVVYNGNLPNYTYIAVNNKNVNNVLFDEYIYLYFDFPDTSYFNSLDDFTLGFDFNFTYWTEPFVIGQSQYIDYNFKPNFMDARIRFSLDPLELVFPIEAWAYNALVYICFYMPLISQILSPFSPFIGGILTSFNFIIGLIPNGAFLLDLLRFVFAYALVSTLVPFFIYIGGKTRDTYVSIKKGRAAYRKNKEKYESNQIKVAHKLQRKREDIINKNLDEQ